MSSPNTPLLKFIPVKSSQLKEVAYDAASETLYVRFHNTGKVYSYSPVSQEKFDGLLAADSVGKYYHAHIRKAVTGKQENPEKFKTNIKY